MVKFSLLESFKYTDEELEDFFFEFFESKDFNLTNGFVNSKNRFFIEPANVTAQSRECKRIDIDFKNDSKGIIGMDSCLSMDKVDALNHVISTVKKFYERSKESISFTVNQQYDEIRVTFFLVGPLVGESLLGNKDEISSLLSELVPILKNRGYKRIKHESTNWLEISTPKKRVNGWDTDTILRNFFERAINGNMTVTERTQPFIDWVNKVIGKNYTISYGGGDLQVVVKLKKN